VLTPEKIKILDPENYIVIIAMGKKEYVVEVKEILKKLNFNNFIEVYKLYEFVLVLANIHIKNEGINFYLNNKSKIIKAFNLLSDDLSRKIFIQILSIYISRIPKNITSEPSEKQYFPDDLKIDYSRFINCGAYDGDTIDSLYKNKGKVSAIACFEPDFKNYSKLITKLNKIKNKLADFVITFPCGVYSVNKYIKFYGGKGVSSHLSENGNNIIQVLKIDDALLHFKPTFIHMDIEGSEIEALKGSKNSILKYKPDMAICVYHTPPHLWDIPLLINSLNPNYELYLRNYTGYIAETVLYAINKDKI
jgi:FkbM family methyltransferase